MLRGLELNSTSMAHSELVGSLDSPLRVERSMADQSPLQRTGLRGYRLLSQIDYNQSAEWYSIIQATDGNTLRIPFALETFPHDLVPANATVSTPFEVAILSQTQLDVLAQAQIAETEHERLSLVFDLMQTAGQVTTNTAFDRIFIGVDKVLREPLVTKNSSRLDPIDRLTIAPAYNGALIHSGVFGSDQFRAYFHPGLQDSPQY